MWRRIICLFSFISGRSSQLSDVIISDEFISISSSSPGNIQVHSPIPSASGTPDASNTLTNAAADLAVPGPSSAGSGMGSGPEFHAGRDRNGISTLNDGDLEETECNAVNDKNTSGTSTLNNGAVDAELEFHVDNDENGTSTLNDGDIERSEFSIVNDENRLDTLNNGPVDAELEFHADNDRNRTSPLNNGDIGGTVFSNDGNRTVALENYVVERSEFSNADDGNKSGNSNSGDIEEGPDFNVVNDRNRSETLNNGDIERSESSVVDDCNRIGNLINSDVKAGVEFHAGIGGNRTCTLNEGSAFSKVSDGNKIETNNNTAVETGSKFHAVNDGNSIGASNNGDKERQSEFHAGNDKNATGTFDSVNVQGGSEFQADNDKNRTGTVDSGNTGAGSESGVGYLMQQSSNGVSNDTSSKKSPKDALKEMKIKMKVLNNKRLSMETTKVQNTAHSVESETPLDPKGGLVNGLCASGKNLSPQITAGEPEDAEKMDKKFINACNTEVKPRRRQTVRRKLDGLYRLSFLCPRIE